MNFLALSSSNGTTLESVFDEMKHGNLTAPCLGLLTDRVDHGCVEKARNAEVTIRVVERIQGELREEYDRRLSAAAIELGADPEQTMIAALGWMYWLSKDFVRQWKRILNVHPSLLPRHPGKHAIRDTLAAGDNESGMTLHWIDEGRDTGPIAMQQKCVVLPDDTEETLKRRIQGLEKIWYPKFLQQQYEDQM